MAMLVLRYFSQQFLASYLGVIRKSGFGV